MHARLPLVDTAGYRLIRRRFVQLGGLGALGGSFPRVRPAEAAALGEEKIRSCILLFFYGGPSHLDMWDPKPDAPAEVRGEFSTIATSAPGVRISEHLPRCAKVADKLAIVRSVHHRMTNHNAAAVEALCGRTPLRGDQELLGDDALAFPCYGALLNRVGRGGSVPSVTLPHVMYNVVRLPGQGAGLLGAAHQPLQIEADPLADPFRVPGLELGGEMTLDRLDERSKLRGDLAREGIRAPAVEAYYERAMSILRSESIRRALDLAKENAAVRDRYGRHRLGQSVLLGRRLVEAGVRFVTIHDGIHNGQEANWDSHADNFGRHKNHLAPPADQAIAALVDDLHARGLLETTLVIAMGEFGRTPKINAAAGRDHWPGCYSVVLAGGGVRAGIAFGRSDRIGAYPTDDPVGTGDLAATVLWRFGVDPHQEVVDATGRPFRLAEGEPVRTLFADA